MTPERFAEVARVAGLSVGHADAGGRARVSGSDPVLPSRFPIGEVAALALAEVADAAAELTLRAGGDAGAITTSVRAGAQQTISFGLMRVDGEVMARTNQSNPFVRAHRCADDRWIFIHGGFPGLQRRLARLLGVPEDASFEEVADAVSAHDSQQLENEIAAVGACGAICRTIDEWAQHPHGQVIDRLPVVERRVGRPKLTARWSPTDPVRPLQGLRVLDLTRVLAGPTCGRTLAAFGADVLQVTGPHTPFVPAFVVDTGHGKRRAHADLTEPADRARLRELALEADVVVQGYRPGIIHRHGLDEETLRAGGFSGVYANISCYGPEGPLAERAGWEQVAQATSGIATAESVEPDRVRLLPAAATDYTTGLLLAGAIVRSLESGEVDSLDASLCQTARLLTRLGPSLDPAEAKGVEPVETDAVMSSFGAISRVGPGVSAQRMDVSWRSPSAALGSSPLDWVRSI